MPASLSFPRLSVQLPGALLCRATWVGLVLLLVSSHADASEMELLDLRQAIVLSPENASGPEKQAVRMLIEEAEKRCGIRWKEAHAWPASGTPVIAVGTASSLTPIAARLADQIAQPAGFSGAEGYRLRVVKEPAPTVLLVGNDNRGVLFAVGRLLRELRVSEGHVAVPATLNLATVPQVKLRGHQLGYRPKTNSYDAWDVATWEQYFRDLAVFGTNAVELVPPRTDDDATSPHFPLPQLEMMIEMSRILNEYDLAVWIWYPALDPDYADAATVEKALKEWEVVFSRLPRIDAIFVPGGDPGHTHPKYMLPFLEKQAANLRRFHPKAEMWVSPQGFDAEWFQVFCDIIQKEQPTWLNGVVHGPQVRVTIPELRRLIPKQYGIRQYPDITHSRQCQYTVPNWDAAFAFTVGREGINPRPKSFARLIRSLAPDSDGFITYSEGCNDDVNKIVCSAVGWDLNTPIEQVLREYSRYFIGEAYADTFAQGLLALERNWDGPVLTNHTIDTTLLQFQELESTASPKTAGNWRFQQALYRAYYDSYIRDRVITETASERRALETLSSAGGRGASAVLSSAERILDGIEQEPVSPEKRAHIFELGDALFRSIRMQLSVKRHQAIAAERGANLDTIDWPVSNRTWLKHRISEIRALASEEERLKAIHEITHWTDPGPGGFYDDLGNPARQPHLLPGEGLGTDPETFRTSRIGYVVGEPYFTNYPMSWLQNAEILYDGPIRMQYDGLDPAARYKIRVSYAGDRESAKIRLVADDNLEVHPLIVKGGPARKMEFDIPAEATRDGKLTLTWQAEPGLGRNGRACQVAEAWLIRK